MEIQTTSSLKDFIENHKELVVVDFSDKTIDFLKRDIKTFLIGCEGGFAEEEKNLFKNNEVIGLQTPLILRSETAIMSVASKILI